MFLLTFPCLAHIRFTKMGCGSSNNAAMTPQDAPKNSNTRKSNVKSASPAGKPPLLLLNII